MSSNSIDEDRLRLVSGIVDAMYDSLLTAVIADIKGLPEGSKQSGDDSGLKDVWEEFKYQMQREQSAVFDLYEEVIEGICSRLVGELDRERRLLLWLWSDGFFDWWGAKDEASVEDFDDEAITKELYNRLCDVAEREELAFDPDEERDRERYEEDMELLRSNSDPDEDAPDYDGEEGNSASGPAGSQSPPPA
jgi:hypothetical protein